VCEQPVKKDEFLSYKDKYMSGGKSAKSANASKEATGSKGMASLDRLIPAPLSDAWTKKIQDTTKLAFRAIDGCGIARIDFMITTTKGKITKSSKLYINEINTMPGSLSFYLWQPSGVNFTELTTKLIELALERHASKAGTMFSIDSGLLEHQSGGGKR
jgi:D-alanine-D-alanine ligase